MVFPFALAGGVGMALGLLGLPILWVLASGAGSAAIYMWNIRASGARGLAGLVAALAAFIGVAVLMALLGGASHLLGSFFRWARLDA